MDTPLRNKLSAAVVQSELFIRFNFLKFGDASLLPAGTTTQPQYFYNDLPAEPDEPDEISDAAEPWEDFI